jgi:hypothetical protein
LLTIGQQGRNLPMSATALVTDADLERARVDPEFRHQLVAGNLEFLLGKLNRLRDSDADASAGQIREGVDLAVQLAELLQRIAGSQPGGIRVG